MIEEKAITILCLALTPKRDAPWSPLTIAFKLTIWGIQFKLRIQSLINFFYTLP